VNERGQLPEVGPDGKVVISGKFGQATWLLSSARNRGTAFILFGSPDDPTDIWVTRISSTEPGVLRTYSKDKATSARMQ
jgi:hypothetical protein